MSIGKNLGVNTSVTQSQQPVKLADENLVVKSGNRSVGKVPPQQIVEKLKKGEGLNQFSADISLLEKAEIMMVRNKVSSQISDKELVVKAFDIIKKREAMITLVDMSLVEESPSPMSKEDVLPSVLAGLDAWAGFDDSNLEEDASLAEQTAVWSDQKAVKAVWEEAPKDLTADKPKIVNKIKQHGVAWSVLQSIKRTFKSLFIGKDLSNLKLSHFKPIPQAIVDASVKVGSVDQYFENESKDEYKDLLTQYNALYEAASNGTHKAGEEDALARLTIKAFNIIKIADKASAKKHGELVDLFDSIREGSDKDAYLRKLRSRFGFNPSVALMGSALNKITTDGAADQAE